MSKRDDDTADLDLDMTTAERRRRRRSGGLRVPSDNVPRRSPISPPVQAPIPEDPSLAMSIAYSFSHDASEPVQRTAVPSFGEPMAPEGMVTVIDPPSAPVEADNFETQTREMSAVDIQALGLDDPESGPAHPRAQRVASPGVEPIRSRIQTEPSRPSSVEVDMDVDMEGLDDDEDFDEDLVEPIGGRTMQMPTLRVFTELIEATPGASASVIAAATPVAARPQDSEHRRTVTLSEEDLEEVREQVRLQSQPRPPRAMTAPPVPVAVTAQPSGPIPLLVAAQPSGPVPMPASAPTINATQPLWVLDSETISAPTPAITRTEGKRTEGMSVPEIDLNELADLAERSEGSGEIPIDVDDELRTSTPAAAVAPAPAAGEPRARPPTVPPTAGVLVTAGMSTSAAVKSPVVAKTPPAPPAPPPKAAKPAAAAVAPAPAAPAKPEGKVPRSKAWFADLFDEDYLRTLPFLTPQATQSEAEFVIDAMGLQAGAQVLDVGCGYGRHAMELAARGFHVVGLDLSTPLLVRGGEEAMRRGLQINFVRGDMRELDFDAQFDGAYCLFSTFGYFDDEANKKAITNIARALKPGGRVVIEILNRDYVIADLPTRVWWEGDGCVVLEEVELNYFSSRIQVNRSVVFDDGRQLEQEISLRAYSLHEVGKLMHAAGFRVLEVSGGYHTRGRFFGNQSRHIIVLAERKEGAAG